MRALILGRRASVLTGLSDGLTARGHAVHIAQSVADVDIDERFDIVAFGRAVKDEARRAVLDQVRSRNPRAQRVDGLAPIPDLLVAQCEWAGRRSIGATDGDPRVLIEAVPQPRVVVRPVPASVDAPDVEIVRHRLTPWFTSRATAVLTEREGTDAVGYFGRQPRASRDFVTVRVAGDAVFVGDSLGRLPLCQ